MLDAGVSLKNAESLFRMDIIDFGHCVGRVGGVLLVVGFYAKKKLLHLFLNKFKDTIFFL